MIFQVMLLTHSYRERVIMGLLTILTRDFTSVFTILSNFGICNNFISLV